MTASKNAEEMEKAPGRPFEPGHPGGPGRPAGSRNKASVLLDKMAEGDAKAVLEKQLELAKGGDQRAAELVLSRIWPARKGRAVTINLQPIEAATDVVTALGTVADAVAMGDLTPDEGASVAAIIEIKRKAIEIVELENRITALESERK